MLETHRTEQPISLPTIPANVGVPLLRSLVYGAFHLGGAIFATHISRKTFLVMTQEASFDVYLWLLRKAVESVNSLTVGGLMFFVSALYHWPKEVNKSDKALWKKEVREQRDINGDGFIGQPSPAFKPPKEPPLTLVYAAASKPKHERLAIFIRGCEHNTAQNYWEGPPRNMPREEYQQFRDALIRLGWARWRSDKSNQPGWELLFTPERIVSGALRHAPPSPTDSEAA